MKNEIKISVVMAVYNGEKYLREALDTVVNQTLREIEIICVDDGSTDNSLKILNEYRAKDNRIQVLQHLEKTDGAAAARNMGMGVATGEYLSFLDADDFFALDMLEKAYMRAKSEDSDVVLFDAYVYDNISKRNYKEKWILNHNNLPNNACFRPDECKDTLFRISMGAAWTAIFRRKMVIDNKLRFESIHHTDDQVFVYLAYCCANHISILDERLIHYRKNVNGSQSANVSLHPEAGYMAPLVLKEKLEEKGFYSLYKNALAMLALEVGKWHLDSMNSLSNFHVLFDALKNKYLRELGTCELTNANVESDLIEWRNSVLFNTSEEYLLKRGNIDETNRYLNNIPEVVKEDDRIIIYGAGVFGRKLFEMIMEMGVFKIAAWVDKNYMNIGYPIQPIDTVLKVEYDYILVAIKYAHVYNAVKANLIDMGVDERKIVWVNKIND